MTLGDTKSPMKMIYRKYQKQRHDLSPVTHSVPTGFPEWFTGDVQPVRSKSHGRKRAGQIIACPYTPGLHAP